MAGQNNSDRKAGMNDDPDIVHFKKACDDKPAGKQARSGLNQA
jgi:hypothetical protein